MLSLVLTCEHGGNAVPPAYASLFEAHQELLSTHRGYDIGAKDLFKELENLARASFFVGTTRLLVELNRSLHHGELFSSITKGLHKEEKQKILQEYYRPYRDAVEAKIQDLVHDGSQVLHISVHSFTPVLQGEERQADVGLLYDPGRSYEKRLCHDWKNKLKKLYPSLRVRFNYPYAGVSDGFPTYLRCRFSEQQYSGIELEINQKFPLGDSIEWEKLQRVMKASLQQVLMCYGQAGKAE